MELFSAVMKVFWAAVALACVVLGFVFAIRGWVRGDTNLLLMGVWFTLLAVSENLAISIRRCGEKCDAHHKVMGEFKP